MLLLRLNSVMAQTKTTGSRGCLITHTPDLTIALLRVETVIPVLLGKPF
jgi:hypothetical protein